MKFKHRNKVIDPSWSEDKSIVYFGLESHLEPDFEAENAAGISNETILAREVTIPNIPSINLWQSLKRLEQPRVAQMKLGNVKDHWGSHGSFHNEIIANLIMNFRDSDPDYLVSVVAAIEIEQNYPIKLETIMTIWNDEIYGLKSKLGIKAWLEARTANWLEGKGRDIVEYFDLGRNPVVMKDANLVITEMQKKAQGRMMTDLGIKYPIDKSLFPEGISSYLADRQWGESWVTKNLKIRTNQANDTYNDLTMIALNNSMSSYPEINYFYEDKFLKLDWLYKRGFTDESNIVNVIKTHNNSIAAGAEVLFQYDISRRLMLLEFDPKAKWAKSPDVLLHKGNIDFIFRTGKEFDSDPKGNLSLLAPINERFGLGDSCGFRALVLWEYLKNLGDHWSSYSNSLESPLKGFFAAPNLKETFLMTVIQLKKLVMSQLIRENNRRQALYCLDFIEASFGAQGRINDTAFCNAWPKSLEDLVAYSFTPIFDLYGAPLVKYGINEPLAAEFLKDNGPANSFAGQMAAFEALAYVLYGCTSPNKRCSSYELAVRQWNTSVVT